MTGKITAALKPPPKIFIKRKETVAVRVVAVAVTVLQEGVPTAVL